MYDSFETIANSTHLVPFSKNYKIENFDSGIEEYNKFLIEEAEYLHESGFSYTQLLLDNMSGDVIGYISLCMGSIKLSNSEKDMHKISSIHFNAIPSLKIGKLAIDKKYKEQCKGYGSYLILIARGIASESSDNGISCRFICVDADIEHNPKTWEFYGKNDFLPNEALKSNNKTISMRLDIFNDEQDSELGATGTEN